MERTRVGVVAALYRHPVKSMRGEALETAPIDWYGVAGDRRYAFLRAGNLTDFPWLTAREAPVMLRYEPYLTEPARPREGAVRVRTPEGADLAVEDEALQAALAAAYGGPVHLMQLNRGMPDVAAISLCGLASIRALGRQLEQTFDPRRFRQNILIETEDGEPFAEERWADRVLGFGDDPTGVRLRLNLRDARCMLVNLDPDTSRQNGAVLREITRTRDGCLGMYGSVEALGEIRVGDAVYVT